MKKASVVYLCVLLAFGCGEVVHDDGHTKEFNAAATFLSELRRQAECGSFALPENGILTSDELNSLRASDSFSEDFPVRVVDNRPRLWGRQFIVGVAGQGDLRVLVAAWPRRRHEFPAPTHTTILAVFNRDVPAARALQRLEVLSANEIGFYAVNLTANGHPQKKDH